ncbi:garvicin Q family class II bacteriocin [Streptococcus thermophilus]|nr:garvicin Q family class II bacteriocin [Streptococcus thermophilus]MCE2071917.1 garvicin Q family class II bacteriocin [Streptococcus thermophilus]MCE2212659.1 garvicin Q family class II bacteriocin [Streptococcus thermophilus]
MNTKAFEQFDVMTDAELSTNGEWGYVVTKGVFQATTDVIANGWVSSLAGAYGYATSWGRRP